MKYFLLILVFLTSCIAQNNPNELASVENIEDETDNEQNILVYTKYNLPLPVDFYRFIKDYESTQNMIEILNPISNIDKYNTNKAQGINFGVFASDLAYCIVAENKQLSIDYFNVTKELADKLHIAKGYNLQVVERLNNNLNDNDSLHEIASKAYWNACNFLEANDEVNTLPLIIAGGWIESIYIACQSVDENNLSKDFLIRLTNERQALENLIQYLLDVMTDSNTFEINADIQELGTKFKAMRQIFRHVPQKEILSKEQFILLKKEISKIRNFYVNQ
jgi:hypothetical protein